MKHRLLIVWLFLFMNAALSQEGGWTLQNTGTTEWLLDVQFTDIMNGWAVGDQGTILRSYDGGTHWVSRPSSYTNTMNVVFFVDTATGWSGGNGTGILINTTDGGSSWSQQDSGNSITDMKFVSQDIGWAITYAGTVLKTTNGGTTWSPQTVPTPFVYFTSMYFFNEDTGFICGKYGGTLLKTVDGGANWVEITGGGLSADDDYNEIFFLNSDVGWLVGYHYDLSSDYGVIKRTTDGGSAWTDQLTFTGDEFTSVAFADSLHGYAVGTQGTLVETTDGGLFWNSLYSGTTSWLSKVFLRPGEAGWIVGVGGVLLRKDLGGLPTTHQLSVADNWNMISLPARPEENRVDSLFPDAVSNLYKYDNGYVVRDSAFVGEGYWMKFSGGGTVPIFGWTIDTLTISLNTGWNMIGGISTNVPVGTIVKSPPSVVLSTFYGFDSTGYSTSDVIESGRGYWVKASEPCELTLYSSVAGRAVPITHFIDPYDLRTDELPPAAPGGGGNPGNLAENSQTPATYRLDQNYPNPFNPVTTIKFSLPEPGTVSLTVFDALGRVVESLVSGKQYNAGIHAVAWDPTRQTDRHISSGIYYYRLTATSSSDGNTVTEMKKMTYLK